MDPHLILRRLTCRSLLSRLLHNPLPTACLQVGQMRTALKEVWQRLLWTTLYDKEHVRHHACQG